jgi:hypothetical protein
MTGYYDLILGLIPASFFGTTGLLHVAGVDLMSALPVAGLIAVLLVGHALFVNGPVDATLTQSNTTVQPNGAD